MLYGWSGLGLQAFSHASMNQSKRRSSTFFAHVQFNLAKSNNSIQLIILLSFFIAVWIYKYQVNILKKKKMSINADAMKVPEELVAVAVHKMKFVVAVDNIDIVEVVTTAGAVVWLVEIACATDVEKELY